VRGLPDSEEIAIADASDVSRSAYDRWSVFYDQEPNPTVAVDEAHFPGIWRRLSGQRVLEIGCGTGRHTLKLARQGNEVVGIDLSLGMLAVARRTLRGHPVKLIHADFMTFDGLAEGDFDYRSRRARAETARTVARRPWRRRSGSRLRPPK
jgi:ubiquinone/menaquinone biosynthesis C-methylase UbiE